MDDNTEPQKNPVGVRHICLLHFNDCYNVESNNQEPIGGAARFVNALRSYDHLKPVVLFSGDIIAPSISEFKYKYQLLVKLNLFYIIEFFFIYYYYSSEHFY